MRYHLVNYGNHKIRNINSKKLSSVFLISISLVQTSVSKDRICISSLGNP